MRPSTGLVAMRSSTSRLALRPSSLVGACLVAALAVASCASPPNKEMDQARGAIDAAKAAGAGQYAAAELTAATEALTQAEAAVAARDYRLALNYALESAEQALAAAGTAADTRARLRGDTERAMAEVKALVGQITTLLESASASQVPRRARRAAQQSVAAIEKTLQEAGAAMEAEDYAKAQQLLAGAKERAQGVVTSVARMPTTQNSPRRK